MAAAGLSREPDLGGLAELVGPGIYGPSARPVLTLWTTGWPSTPWVVALPDALHVEPAVAAAERGLAVLLEKPMASDETALAELKPGCAA